MENFKLIPSNKFKHPGNKSNECISTSRTFTAKFSQKTKSSLFPEIFTERKLSCTSLSLFFCFGANWFTFVTKGYGFVAEGTVIMWGTGVHYQEVMTNERPDVSDTQHFQELFSIYTSQADIYFKFIQLECLIAY